MHKAFKRRDLLGSAGVMATAIAALSSIPAHAQDTAGASAETPTAEIVVTGSRIQRRDYEANSPLVTIAQDSFENRSTVGVEETLNELPQFTTAGTNSLSSSAGTAFPGANQAPGAATLDLRGLGTNRTLVLVNGRRAQPVNAQLVVDVNTIPAQAIRNVEVITGGAAAVYGADAIAGVVNFMLRDDFEGLEVDGQFGISEQGDAETYQVSGLVGGNFGDGRGNAMLGIVFSDRAAAYQRNRDFYTRAWNDSVSAFAEGGMPLTVAAVNGVNYGVNPDGTLFDMRDVTNPAAPYTGPLNNLAGGAGYKLNPASPGTTAQTLGFIDPERYNSIPLTRYSLFGSAHYDINDSITAFFEGTFTHSEAYAQSLASTAGNIWAINLPYDPANDDPDSPTFGANQNNFHPVSAPLADLLNSRADPSAPWSLSRGLNFLGRLYVETTSEIYQLTAGLRGDFGFKDWTWEVYGSHGSTNVITRQPQGPISYEYLQQVFSGTTGTGALSPTINGPWSQNWSSGATFNPSNCTSGIPLFNADGSVPQASSVDGEGVQISDDCKGYVTLELNNVTQLEQNIVEATMQGGLFDLWAGEVRFALGATYRDADFSFSPDTGNSGEQPGTGVIGQIALPKPTSGGIAVKEIYGEVLVPLLSDLPLIQQLDLELGGRYSDYDLSGGIATYKMLADWRVSDWLRFRGGYQRANRAPNIYELFAPVAGGLGSSQDPCVNIAGFTPAFGNTPDNPNLLNLQEACEALIVRDGGYDYVTLAEDPNAVAQDPALFPNLDRTRLSNHRNILTYNLPFPYSVGLEQGNINLQSEKADTITIGAVINSPFDSPLLNQLTLTADYYSIKLKGTIGAPSGVEIYTQCLSPEYNPRIGAAPGTYSGAEILEGNFYCDLVNRYPYDEFGVLGAPGSGTDRTYNAQFLNKGGTKTSGLDLTANWTADLADMGINAGGAINLYVAANILLGYKEASFAGAPYVDFKGTSENLSFDYKLFGTLSYRWDAGTVGVRGQYLPSIEPSPFDAPGTTGAKAYTQFSLFGRYSINDTIEMRAGVDNLFDAKPAQYGSTLTDANRDNTLPVYDTIGRSYYLGARLRF